jgi:hypothetical protein
MTGRQTSAQRVRVVILSPDRVLSDDEAAALAQAGVDCVRVVSAYEAAAELLSEPASALAADLRMIGPRHLRLLGIARRQRAEMLGVGSVPPGLTPEDLSGVRLLARRDLAAALERLAAVERPAEPPAEGRPAPPAEAASSTAEAAVAVRLVPPGPVEARPAPPPQTAEAPPTETPQPAPPDEQGEYAPAGEVAEPPPEHEAPAPQAPERSAADVLTPEELAALLRDQP